LEEKGNYGFREAGVTWELRKCGSALTLVKISEWHFVQDLSGCAEGLWETWNEREEQYGQEGRGGRGMDRCRREARVGKGRHL
jgi:hypothetical protein